MGHRMIGRKSKRVGYLGNVFRMRCLDEEEEENIQHIQCIDCNISTSTVPF